MKHVKKFNESTSDVQTVLADILKKLKDIEEDNNSSMRYGVSDEVDSARYQGYGDAVEYIIDIIEDKIKML